MKGWWLLPVALLLVAACGVGDAGGGAAQRPAAGGPTIAVGENADFSDVTYIAVERVSLQRLPRERLEPVGEARLEKQVRRVAAFRLKDSPKAALRYTEDAGRGWLAWQPHAVLYARRELARQAGRPVAQIQTLDVRHETWPDGCLGVAPSAGGGCASGEAAGFVVVLRLDGRTYTYHTDLRERAVLAT